MHINVVTLSNIIDRRTSAIKLQAYEVKFQKDSSQSGRYYKWPEQQRPPLKDRRHWHNFLRRQYNLDMGNLDMVDTCGEWTREASTAATWTHSEQNNEVYEKCERGWRKWKMSKQ